MRPPPRGRHSPIVPVHEQKRGHPTRQLPSQVHTELGLVEKAMERGRSTPATSTDPGMEGALLLPGWQIPTCRFSVPRCRRRECH